MICAVVKSNLCIRNTSIRWQRKHDFQLKMQHPELGGGKGKQVEQCIKIASHMSGNF